MIEHLPDDENGEILRRMRDEGEDLSVSREVEFSVIFSNGEIAQQFSEIIKRHGYGAEKEYVEYNRGHVWDVTVRRVMPLSHVGITDFENFLEGLAAARGGQMDGWGCFRASG
jgi:hypothetical protein